MEYSEIEELKPVMASEETLPPPLSLIDSEGQINVKHILRKMRDLEGQIIALKQELEELKKCKSR